MLGAVGLLLISINAILKYKCYDGENDAYTYIPKLRNIIRQEHYDPDTNITTEFRLLHVSGRSMVYAECLSALPHTQYS